jgi:hypothetical protein
MRKFSNSALFDVGDEVFVGSSKAKVISFPGKGEVIVKIEDVVVATVNYNSLKFLDDDGVKCTIPQWLEKKNQLSSLKKDDIVKYRGRFYRIKGFLSNNRVEIYSLADGYHAVGSSYLKKVDIPVVVEKLKKLVKEETGLDSVKDLITEFNKKPLTIM